MNRRMPALMSGLAIAAVQSTLSADVMSYPPPAFEASDSSVSYTSTGYFLSPGADANASASMNAPVQLPHGAKITKVKLVARDGSTQNVSVLLRRSANGSPQTIATLSTTGSSPAIQSIESAALTEVVNHEANVYFLELLIPPRNTGEAFFISVVITFDPPAPSPAPCVGDVNNDRRVDTSDLSVILARFGSVCTP